MELLSSLSFVEADVTNGNTAKGGGYWILGNYVFVFIKGKSTWQTIALYNLPSPKSTNDAKIIAIDLDNTNSTPTSFDWSNCLIGVNNGSNFLIFGAYIKQ